MHANCIIQDVRFCSLLFCSSLSWELSKAIFMDRSSFFLAPWQCTPRIPGASFYSGSGLQFGHLHGPLNHLCVLLSLPNTSPEPSICAWSWWNFLPGKIEPRLSSTHQGFIPPQHFKGNGTCWEPCQNFCSTVRRSDSAVWWSLSGCWLNLQNGALPHGFLFKRKKTLFPFTVTLFFSSFLKYLFLTSYFPYV